MNYLKGTVLLSLSLKSQKGNNLIFFFFQKYNTRLQKDSKNRDMTETIIDHFSNFNFLLYRFPAFL